MKVQVCKGKTCTERFCGYITKRLESDKGFYGKDNVILEECLCLGQCKSGPNIIVDGQIHNYMDPAKASKLVYSNGNNNKKKKK